MNSVHGRADSPSKASADILILGLICENANQSKDILNLDVVIDYDSNFLYFMPVIWVLNVFEMNLLIKLAHAGLKGVLDILFHKLLHLQVNFEDIREVLEFLDLLRDLFQEFFLFYHCLFAMGSLLKLPHGFFYGACVIPYDFLHPPLKVKEHLSSCILDFGDLSEGEDVFIDLANICIF